MLTNESSGLPSKSGSGRFPNLELFEADLPRVVVEKEPFGDIIYPAGEYPPDLAALFTSMMELGLDISLETCGISLSWDKIDDRRLSERFCSI